MYFGVSTELAISLDISQKYQCYWNSQMTDWEDEQMNKSQIKMTLQSINNYLNTIQGLLSHMFFDPRKSHD
jgi:hypothetical protein